MFEANDTTLSSFLEIEASSNFPIQNLPYGVFRTADQPTARVGTAIGGWVLDLATLESEGLLETGERQSVFAQNSLNRFMSLGRSTWTAVRQRVTQLLRDDEPRLRDDAALRERALVSRDQVQMLMPVEIGDYTDFYSSRHHATNVSTMIHGADQTLQENWLHLPVGYHGRASSVVLSGTDVRRPQGQLGPGTFGPSRALDFELEVGFFVGSGSNLGETVTVDRAVEHIFGMVLVNDWSARDIQKWEYVPLGPFLSKSFATSISPWVVPLDALMPFRVPPAKWDPSPLPYLQWADDFLLDMELQVTLTPAGSSDSHIITNSNFQYLYWTMAQQLAQQSVNGCNLRPGDLLASGTVSGPKKESRGCLLELTWRGAKPIELPEGDQRVFLKDGDQITISGWCGGQGYRVGFGNVTGRILPSE